MRILSDTLAQCWFNVGPASQTMVQHLTNIGSVYRADWVASSYWSRGEFIHLVDIQQVLFNINYNLSCA